MRVIRIKKINSSEYSDCYVDDEDYGSLSRHKWRSDGRGYAVRTETAEEAIGKSRRGNVLMHRQILGAPSWSETRLVVDHVNGNVLDNQRKNLRLCTQRQNAWNSRQTTRSKTGIKGVFKNGSGFVAQISIDGKAIYLGLYKNIEDAAEVYAKHAEMLRGEFNYKAGNLCK